MTKQDIRSKRNATPIKMCICTVYIYKNAAFITLIYNIIKYTIILH